MTVASLFGGWLGPTYDPIRQLGIPIASPYLTQGKMWTPMEVKTLLHVCRLHFLTQPLVNAAITKMATYPITEVLYETKDPKVRQVLQSFFTKVLDLRTILIENGLDYNVYGNALISLAFPFIKYLECASCKYTQQASKATFDFQGGDFLFYCPKCGTRAVARAFDKPINDPHGIRIIRWNPEDFTIYYEEVTGERLYRYDIPPRLRHGIIAGKRHIVTKVPQEFIVAVKKHRPLIFEPDNLFHMKRPGVSSHTLGKAWGVPMILPVLEDIHYLQMLRKAQETIASEHLVPLRILFPQGTSQMDQPFGYTNLVDWQKQVHEEITKFRRDRNYIPVLPVPIGNQTIAGDGRALLLHQEIRVISEHIISGMGVPVEFVFGGLSYAGTSVSIRMLENAMLNYRQEHLRFLNWIGEKISRFMGWPSVKLSLRDFRMADDLNRRQYLFNLWSAGLLSAQDLLEESGYNFEEQMERREGENDKINEQQKKQMISQAEAQIEANRKQQLAQMEMQMEMQMAGMAGQPGQEGAPQEGMPPEQMPPEEMPPEQGGMPPEGMTPEQAQQMGYEQQPGMEGQYPPEQYPPQEQQPGGMPPEAGSPLNINQGQNALLAGQQQQPSLLLIAQQLASRLSALPPMERFVELARIRKESAELADFVVQLIKQTPQPPPEMPIQ